MKHAVRHVAIRTPVRRVAEPVYDALTRAGLAGARVVDRVLDVASSNASLESVTAIVKTFERPAMLERLIASARRLFPSLRIIVADDSRVPAAVPGVEMVTLPFDSGVSAGRQAALDRVTTKYTWLLDDDFVFYWGTRVGTVLSALEAYDEVDIIGGPVVNLPLWQKRGSVHGRIYPTEARPVVPPGTRFGPVEVCDKVPNFFVARTERLRQVGWTSEVKRLDHADFFTRARGVLVTAYCDAFRCLHGQTPFDDAYQRHRQDVGSDRELLRRRYF